MDREPHAHPPGALRVCDRCSIGISQREELNMTKRLIGRELVLLLCAIAALGLLAAAALADGGITT